MAKNNPLVSVIIPCFNVAATVEEAVDSILSQTYENIEVIVVDDGSTDDTYAILCSLKDRDDRVTVLKNTENMKIVGTLNRGIDHSSGLYIARMDGDDYKYPDAIEKQVRFMEDNPKVSIVGGSIEICDADMRVLHKREYPLSDADVRKKMFRYSPFAHPAVMIRAAALDDERYELNWAEDYDLYFRLGIKGEFANLKDCLLRLRTHRGSVSQSKLRYQEGLTMYIRLKAVYEYGYSMSGSDKAYMAIQYITQFLMPAGFRFWLFSKLRSVRR